MIVQFSLATCLDTVPSNVLLSTELPQLGNEDHQHKLAEALKESKVKLVIIDPVYLCLGDGKKRINPANLFEIGELLLQFMKVCAEVRCTPVLVHHTIKSSKRQDRTLELGDLAWAGFSEFFRQWLLVKERKRYDPETGTHRLRVVYGGSVGHSGSLDVDIVEGKLQSDGSGRTWKVDCRPAKSQVTEPERKTRDRMTPEEGARRFQSAMDALKIELHGDFTNKAIKSELNRKSQGLDSADYNAARSLLIDRKVIQQLPNKRLQRLK
jgi:hypothetical protein